MISDFLTGMLFGISITLSICGFSVFALSMQKQKRWRRKSEDTKSDFSGIKRERKT